MKYRPKDISKAIIYGAPKGTCAKNQNDVTFVYGRDSLACARESKIILFFAQVPSGAP